MKKITLTFLVIFFVVSASSMLPAIAKDKLALSDFLANGFKVVSSTSENHGSDLALFLQKGTEVVYCPIQLKNENGKLVNGPWNDYSECIRLSLGSEN